MKKVLKIITYVIPLLVVLTLAFFGIKYSSEIRTLLSIKKVEGTNLYTMEYFSDYKFEDFLMVGADNNNAYYDYINSLMDGKLNIGIVNQSTENACTAFSAKDSGSNRYLARNFDNTPNPVMLVVTSPEHAYKSISAVNLNCLGYTSEKVPKEYDLNMFAAPYFPTDGMNEKGISISMLQVNFARKQKEPNKTTINAYALIRLVLDHADSIDRAVALIENYNIYFDASMNAHFFICDKNGSSALIEFVNGEMHVIYPDDDYQVASNFNNTEERFDDDGYVYPKQYRDWLQNTSVSAYDSEYSGYIRYDLVLDMLYNNSGILSIDDSFGLLEDVASPDRLQYAVVYNMSRLEATIITDNDWEKKTTVAIK